VYTITLKRRINKAFIIILKGKVMSIVVKVNMVSHMLFVAFCCCFKLN
jgi:hypothetical protein